MSGEIRDAAAEVDGRAESSGRAVPSRWTVVIPVKAFAAAKTRLGPVVPAEARAALARAFALDTIHAAQEARSVDRVIVITGEIGLGTPLPEGVEVVGEPDAAGSRLGDDDGRAVPGRSSLDTAIDAGVALARQDGDVPVAVLLGDLPSLRTSELEFALDAAARHPLAFIADADGTGTTLATAGAGVPMRPAFGEQSASRHREAGFADLAGSAPFVSL
ncbi:MAG TPA: 2-phospho-L-lactate guanylyltransferase, partial [Agromyces sp.]